MTEAAIVVGLCLLFEAFFSGGELALISADKVRLRHLAEQGGRRGRLLMRFLDDPGELISTALTGTNICVVLSTVTATVTLLRHYPQHAELLSLAIMTPLVLIIGEIVPKSVFHRYADELAPRLVVIFSGFRIVFWPVVSLGGRLSGLLMRVLRIERRQQMTRDELRLLIRLPSRPGADRITAEERQMIARVFDLSETAVKDVMVPLSGVSALPETASIEDVARRIGETGHTRLAVCRERVDQIVGIVHGFDVLRAEPGAGLASLCRPALYVPGNQPAVDTLVMMQRESQHMVVVVDEFGGAVGVVTIEDVLEEIVGEIRDEYDEQEVRGLVCREKGGVYRVKGRTEVEELNLQTELGLPESDDYETVAGLVLDRLKRIPRVGESLDVSPTTTIKVTEATERSIEEVLIQPRKKARGSPTLPSISRPRR